LKRRRVKEENSHTLRGREGSKGAARGGGFPKGKVPLLIERGKKNVHGWGNDHPIREKRNASF